MAYLIVAHEIRSMASNFLEPPCLVKDGCEYDRMAEWWWTFPTSFISIRKDNIFQYTSHARRKMHIQMNIYI